MVLIQLVLLLVQAYSVLCNTEKTIFLAPNQMQIPAAHPTLDDLQLEALSPEHWSLRTYIRSEFPTNSSRYGQASWYLLQGLQEGQRYEVRICWAATQPTDFRLDTYTLQTVFDTPELITSLAQFSEGRQPDPTEVQNPSITKAATSKSQRKREEVSSTLLLQIFAAADYYTMNKTLMEHVPPVFVDIILDPYLFNVFPRSLVPTAAYIVLLAIGSWYLSKYISKWFQNLGENSIDLEKKDS